MVESAGIVAYRGHGDRIEVLLVHPSGNYNRRAPWSIPKGLPDEGETLTAAALRETFEETGVDLRASAESAPLTPLGSVQYTRSRKRIHAFAALAPSDAAPHPASWEVDRAEFVPLDEARTMIHPEQLPLLDRLVEHLR